MITDFTEEEKSIVWSAQYENDMESGSIPERIPCIQRLLLFMIRERDSEIRNVIRNAKGKVAMMRDHEYASYDFRPNDEEIT